jgi:hypothetical protein
MVISPAGFENKKDCDGESQEQFSRRTEMMKFGNLIEQNYCVY